MDTTKSLGKKKLGKVISIDEGQIKNHLGEIVRDTVEETLNGFWMPRRTAYARRVSMSATETVRTHALEVISASSIPRPAKWN